HLGELAAKYAPQHVKVLLVAVEEERAHWLEYQHGHVPASVITVWDGSGEAARKFAPPGAQPSFTDRAQVVLASSLVLDPQGKIRLFLMSSSRQFDPTFAGLQRELDGMLGALPPSAASAPAVAAAPAAPVTAEPDAQLTPEQVVDFAP